jgi:hypothetical protein
VRQRKTHNKHISLPCVKEKCTTKFFKNNDISFIPGREGGYFAVRGGVCLAFFYGRTANKTYTVRFPYTMRLINRTANKLFAVRTK